MSDPVSNADIEDVLSSIRRLVSVDNKVEKPSSERAETSTAPVDIRREAEAPAAEAQETPREDARLVLTPSFRIDPTPSEADEPTSDDDEVDGGSLTLEQWQVTPASEAEAAPIQQDDSEGEVHAAESDMGADAVPEQISSDEEEAFLDEDLPARGETWQSDEIAMDEARAQEWLEEGDAAQDDDEIDLLGDEAEGDALDDAKPEADQGVEAEAAEHRIEELLGDTDTPLSFVDELPREANDAADEVPEEMPAPASELEARIAEVEAAVAARQDQWEPDGEDQDEYAGGPTEPLPWEDHVEDMDQDEARRPEFASATPEGMPKTEPIPESEPEMTFSAEIAELEDAEPASEPAAAMPEPVAEPVAQTSEPSADEAAWYNEDTVLDEEALRDLVSEIVRQELQGTLGERITRNVRKLVRREIHRAMLGQDFD